LLLLGILPCLQAQEPALSSGFEHFYNLEYDEAITDFSRQLSGSPADPALYNHLAQAVLYREMFRAGALESELVSGTNPFLRRPKMNPSIEDQCRFDDSIRKSIDLCQQRLRSNPRDTRALYTLGVAYALRANYNFLVRKAWLDALRDATQGRKLHNKVTELDPENIDARLLQGVHEYVVGSLPWHIRVMGFLLGFRGDREAGIRILELVARRGNVNRYDAQVLLCAIYRRERQVGKAIPLLQGLIRRFPRNYLLRFELAQMYADQGDKKAALAVVKEIEELKTSDAPGFRQLPLEKIWYARGTIQFWYNDLDEALENMKRVTQGANRLDLNTEVTAWMRLGQIHDLKGERMQALRAYQKTILLAPESDPAKEAKKFLSEPYRRVRVQG